MDQPYASDRLFDELPDPSAHRWGWVARKVDGIWCVGQKDNLQTKYDAALQITGGFLSDEEARETAEWIADALNEERAWASLKRRDR